MTLGTRVTKVIVNTNFSLSFSFKGELIVSYISSLRDTLNHGLRDTPNIS